MAYPGCFIKVHQIFSSFSHIFPMKLYEHIAFGGYPQVPNFQRNPQNPEPSRKAPRDRLNLAGWPAG